MQLEIRYGEFSRFGVRLSKEIAVLHVTSMESQDYALWSMVYGPQSNSKAHRESALP